MTASLTPPQSPDEDDAYYRAVLHKLIEQGAALATQIVENAAKAPPGSDPAPAFDRIARTIRRTIALARHIAEDPGQQRSTRAAKREKIIRGVEDVIESRRRMAANLGERSESLGLYDELHAEFHERLDHEAFERDLQGRPVEDFIDDILRDLGLGGHGRKNNGKRRTLADLATLQARAAAPSNENPVTPGLTRGPASMHAPFDENPVTPGLTRGSASVHAPSNMNPVTPGLTRGPASMHAPIPRVDAVPSTLSATKQSESDTHACGP